VSPPDCCLLVCVPMVEAEFLRNLRDKRHDFAASVFRRNKGLSDRSGWSFYEDEAHELRATCSEATAYGVQVQRDATLTALADSCRAYHVVTLIAHCRISSFQPEEILDPHILLDAEHAKADLSPAQAAFLGALRRAHDADVRSQPTPSDVARTINSMIWTDGIEEGDFVQRAALSRLDIEDLFPAAVASAGAVEFADGLHATSELVAAIPPTWDGVLDLTLCNSSHVGRVIRRHRAQCTVVVNSGLATLMFRTLRYRLVLSELARSPEPFLESLRRVQLALLEETR